MAKKRTRTTRSKKKSTIYRVLLSNGSITFKVLLAVIIIGSIALVSGIFPTDQITPQDPDAPVVRPVFDQDNIDEDSLQLRTIGFEQCAKTVAIEMVLDRSGSMGGQKIQDLKTASLFFISQLPDNAPFGLITYSDTITEVYEIQQYGDIKNRVENTISGLRAGGFTHTREAMNRANQALDRAMTQYPERQFSLILVSDGIPETSGRVPDPEMDPRRDPNIASDIKNKGVNIYTIAITQGLSADYRSFMTEMMTEIATPNGFFEAPNTNQLEDIYNQISFEMCQSAS